MSHTGKRLTTRLDADGTLTVELQDHTWPAPQGSEVLVRVEATPINPSDLGLLFGPAEMENATYQPGRIVARMPEAATRAMAGRHGMAMPAGNECAGTVVAAGDDPAAQALIGQRIACVPGTSYAQYALADARMSLPLPEGVSAQQGASSYVNPMTALGFVETMKAGGFTGMIHTAAASNLGQMLVRICQADGIPLVNVVRSPAQEALLRGLGAEHVLDSSQDRFMPNLITAIEATGAMVAFDAIGGGDMASRLLTAMEAVASKGAEFSRYGSSASKHVYIYGALDLSPTVLTRNFGFTWDVSGWLLMPFLTRFGMETVLRMRARVLAELTTTFASHYKAEVDLEGMLSRDAVREFNARRTGEKYLVLPNG